MSPNKRNKELNIKEMETKNTHSSTAEEFYLTGVKWLKKRRLTKIEEPKESERSPEFVQGKMRHRMITFS